MPAESTARDRGLERPQIVEAALKLLNEVGFSGLALRKLAAALGVKAAALYWHFENKQDLIDAMALAIMSRPIPAEQLQKLGWRDLLLTVARHNRANLRAYRDGAQIMAHANLARAETMERLERMLAALHRHGFSDELAMFSFIALMRFTIGCVFEEQADPHTTAAPDPAARQHLHELVSHYPHFLSVIKKTPDIHAWQDIQFERGLAIIVDGVAKQLDEQ